MDTRLKKACCKHVIRKILIQSSLFGKKYHSERWDGVYAIIMLLLFRMTAAFTDIRMLSRIISTVHVRFICALRFAVADRLLASRK